MLSFITWLWKPEPTQDQRRYSFDANAVNTLFSMIDRNFAEPHRKICVTNMPKGIDGSIEIVKDTADFANVQNPNGKHNPSCYRRLRMFRRDADKTFGERMVSMDLDTVITGNLQPLFDRPEPFVIWGQSEKGSGWYNGSLMMLTAGARPQVWEQFNPRLSPMMARRARSMGSDQGWLGYILGRNEATWSIGDGVYSYRIHISPNGKKLPPNAKVVNFHGKVNPWSYEVMHTDWIKEHYH